MDSGFELDETTFMDNLKMKIEEFSKRSIAVKIKNEWIRISDAQTPDEWAMDNRIPARYVFGNHYPSLDLLRAVNQPEELSAAKLEEMLELLKGVKTANVADSQKAFMADVVPKQYKKFEIGLAPVLEYLCNKHGNQPNKWHFPIDIAEFIKSQYKASIAPQVKEKLRTSDAEALKERLLRLADENPELGLLFLED